MGGGFVLGNARSRGCTVWQACFKPALPEKWHLITGRSLPGPAAGPHQEKCGLSGCGGVKGPGLPVSLIRLYHVWSRVGSNPEAQMHNMPANSTGWCEDNAEYRSPGRGREGPWAWEGGGHAWSGRREGGVPSAWLDPRCFSCPVSPGPPSEQR